MPIRHPPSAIRHFSPPLWRNVSFLLMWSSTAASGFGDRLMMLTALALLGGVAGAADSAAISAGINFWFFLPYLVFSIPAGFVADKLPRKWMLLTCDEARALILLLCWLMLAQAAGQAALPDAAHWKVLAAMFAVGIFAAIFNPVRNATIPQIVELEQLQPANALIIVIAVVASLIGLGVGGYIIDPQDAGSVRHGLMLAVVFYGGSGLFFAFLRVRGREVGDTARGPATSGTRFILQHRRVVVLIVINIIVWGAAMVVANAAISLCKTRYGFTDQTLIFKRYTQMSAMLGAGMLAGAVAVAWVRTRRESGTLMAKGLCMTGVSLAVLSLSPWYSLAMLAAFGIGFFGNVVIVSVATILQTISPNHVRGRVMGLNSMLSTASNVAVNGVIWRMTHADTGVLIVLYTLAPLFFIMSFATLWHEARSGPMLTRTQNLLWRADRLFVLVWHRLTWRGRENVPATGPVILASNHTTGLDPLLIQAACSRHVRWLMIDKYQLRALGFVWRAIKPISFTFGDKATAQVRAVVEALEAGEVVGIFPEGGLQRDTRELRPFGAGVVMIAQRSGSPVVPVWVEGTPRKQSLLAHLLWPSRSRVRFGEPYRIDPDADRDAALDELKRRMTALSS